MQGKSSPESASSGHPYSFPHQRYTPFSRCSAIADAFSRRKAPCPYKAQSPRCHSSPLRAVAVTPEFFQRRYGRRYIAASRHKAHALFPLCSLRKPYQKVSFPSFRFPHSRQTPYRRRPPTLPQGIKQCRAFSASYRKYFQTASSIPPFRPKKPYSSAYFCFSPHALSAGLPCCMPRAPPYRSPPSPQGRRKAPCPFPQGVPSNAQRG